MRIGLQTWGSEGDARPFIALAAGLVRAGHEVALAITDNAARDYSGSAARFGFRLIEAPHPDKPTPEHGVQVLREIVATGDPVRQAELLLRFGFDPVAGVMHDAARRLCAENDAVIGHFFLFPLQVEAEKAGLPLIKVMLAHNCLPSREICPPGLPDLGRWSYPLGWRLTRWAVNRIFLPRINALRQREGLAPDRDVMTRSWISPVLNLVAVSPSLRPAPADWAGRCSLSGFLRLPDDGGPDEALPPGLEDFLSAGPPPVYFSFGSMLVRHPTAIREVAAIWEEAVRRAGCRAVFQLPGEEPGPLQGLDQAFVVPRAPHARVFPRCAAVAHHGGAGTVQTTLLAGRPSVVVAHLADQFFWGDELARLGAAGPKLTRRELDAGTLAEALRRVLDSPDMQARAAALGAAMAREQGLDQAVRLIEERLAGRAAASQGRR
jgi:UDP:flavonoid glycosyltransferase YjiC (YdhE family)